MKQIIAALLLASSAQAHSHLERPIEDSFLWMNAASQDSQGTLRRVEVKRVNKLVSPGIFTQRRWDLIQACLGKNSDSEQWYADAPHPHYKADLQMLQLETYAGEDPCEVFD